jgi:hypothetical protein
MSHRADIVITGKDGRPAAVVELKNRRDLTPEAAASVRRSLAARGELVGVPYFLVLSGETGCLWRNGNSVAEERAPELCFPVGDALRRVFPRAPMPPVSHGQLSLMVFQWLAELTGLSGDPPDEPERSLAQTGLLRAIRGGTLEREAEV